MGSKLREIGAITPDATAGFLPGCTGKEAFTSALTAHEVNRRRNRARRHLDRGRSVGDVYRCRFCGWFHIGSAEHAPPGRR